MHNSAVAARALVARTAHLIAVTAPSIGGRAGQFIALVVLAAIISPVEYGRFVVVQTLVVGIASVLGSSSAAAVNGATARVPGARTIPVHVLFAALTRGRRGAFAVGAVCSAALVPVGYGVVTGTAPSPVELTALAALGLLSGAMPLGDVLVAVISGSGRYLAGSTLDAGRAVVGAGAALTGAVLLGPVGGGFGLVLADLLLVSVVMVRAARPTPSAIQVTTALPPRDGMVAGIVANVTGQVAQWVLLFAIQVVGGPLALGVYGVANRFASVVTLAPITFGKTVIGQLADDSAVDRRWTPRSFIGMLTVLSTISAAAAFTVMIVGFPGLVDRYDGLVPIAAVLLLGTIARAVLIGVGHVCVARRQWQTWVIADLASLVVTVLGAAIAWQADIGVAGVLAAYGLGNGAGIVVRVIGTFRRPSAVTAEVAR